MNYFELFKIVFSRKPASPDFKEMNTQEIIDSCDRHIGNMKEIVIFDRINIEVPETYPIQKFLVPRYWKKQYEISFEFIKAAFEYDECIFFSKYGEAQKIDSSKTK